ncbi:MAG: polysaccharide pyruvyl transferase family protein [Coleofasciculus sp. Co-bin14]|nr:polysaccharide pyruvyl transferase family protein [Coleofasciculus sp. Co-bin14]
MKTLVVGWFSYEQCNVTAGDLMARDLACEWLEQAGHTYDVALAPPFVGGVDWRSVDPNAYSHVVFVCGPFPYMAQTTEFVQRFTNCRLIGLDLSMIESLDVWNPFDILLARDSSADSHPDITFLSRQAKVPIVGIILVHPQDEYKGKGRHQVANDAINRLVASREMVAVPIDTGLDPNTTNLRSAAEVESLIARMDVVVTTRLHGTVLALKNGVPTIAIDAISGGAKVLRQAQTIGWPLVFPIDDLTDEALHKAFDYCQTEEARSKARECRDRSIAAVERVRDAFISALNSASSSSSRVGCEEALKKLEPPRPTTRQVALYKARTIKHQAIQAIGKWLLSLLKNLGFDYQKTQLFR